MNSSKLDRDSRKKQLKNINKSKKAYTISKHI